MKNRNLMSALGLICHDLLLSSLQLQTTRGERSCYVYADSQKAIVISLFCIDSFHPPNVLFRWIITGMFLLPQSRIHSQSSKQKLTYGKR